MSTRSPRGPIARLVMFVAAVGLFGVGYYWGNRYQFSGDPPVIGGVLLRVPVSLPDFTLRDANGQPFALDTLRGHWTLLAFAEPDSVGGHLTVNRMIGVYNRLADQPDLRDQTLLALASTGADLGLARDFLRLTPALRVLSGDAEELTRLQASVGEAPSKENWPDGVAPLYLIDPRARLMAVFPAGQDAVLVVSDLSALAARPDLLEPVVDE